MTERLLTPKEVCELLRISHATFSRMAMAGRLPAFRVGEQWRVKPTDLDEWLDSRRRQKSRLKAVGA